MSYVVNVGFDREEGRYYVLSSDVPGLHVEATTFDEFMVIVRDVAPALIEVSAGSSLSFRRELEFA